MSFQTAKYEFNMSRDPSNTWFEFSRCQQKLQGTIKKNLETLLSIKKKLKELASGLKSAPTPPLYYVCLSMRDMPRLVCKTAYIDKNLL